MVLVRTVFSVILGCGCHLRHTTSEGCDVHGKCLCKENYDSKTCGRCKLGYVDFPTCRKLGKKKLLITASILSFPKRYHAPVSYKDKYLKSITVFFESLQRHQFIYPSQISYFSVFMPFCWFSEHRV